MQAQFSPNGLQKTSPQRDNGKPARANSTQRAAVLNLLAKANGAWVPLPEILALGVAQYNARVFELRRLGFAIENRIGVDSETGARHSWFRLVETPSHPNAKPTPKEDIAESAYMRRVREEQEQALPLFSGDPR